MHPGGIRNHNLSRREASDRAATGTGSEYTGLQIKYVLSQIPGYTAELMIFK